MLAKLRIVFNYTLNKRRFSLFGKSANDKESKVDFTVVSHSSEFEQRKKPNVGSLAVLTCNLRSAGTEYSSSRKITSSL